MTKFAIPPEFAKGVVAERGSDAKRWLEELPSRIDKYMSLWNLSQDGNLMHGYLSVVVPVTCGGKHYALKVTWPDDYVKHEALALRLWRGNGAVKP